VSPVDSWGRAALADTLQASYGAGSDIDLPDEIRFLRGVSRAAKKRFGKPDEPASHSPCIFVLHPPTAPEIDGRDRQHVPMVGNGLNPLSNRVWLTNFRVNDSYSYALTDAESDGETWEWLTSELGVGELPTVVLESRHGGLTATFYPAGISHPKLAEESDLTRTEITPDAVFAAIDEIYKGDLCTPDAQGETGTAWAEAPKGYASQKAEKSVQKTLKIGLARAFSEFIVREEQPQIMGRTDLEIEEALDDDPTTVTRHFVLELKVLRDCSDSGRTKYVDADNQKVIESGLIQVKAYREHKPTRAAALCSFDMRKVYSGRRAYGFVRERAETVDVLLWIWHLFASSDAARRYEFDSGQTVGGER